jgi:hypothetical protein
VGRWQGEEGGELVPILFELLDGLGELFLELVGELALELIGVWPISPELTPGFSVN